MNRLRARMDQIVPSLATGVAFEDVESDVMAGRSLFFEGRDAVLVVQIVNDQDGLSFNIWLAGGAGKGIPEGLRLLEGIEALARGAGAKFCSFTGRKGWKRLMRPYGYVGHGQECRKVF